MQKYGFHFRKNKSRDVIISCPCCKDHSVFVNPEKNIDELIELMKFSKDAFYLDYYGDFVNDPFIFDDDTSSSLPKLSERPANEKINSENISNYPSIDYSNLALKVPYGDPVMMTCRKCNEEFLSYYYDPENRYPRPFYTGCTIDENYKKVFLNIKGFIYTFFGNKVQTHHYMTRIVFNKWTGRVTILRPLGSDNKPLRLFPDFAPMWNVTYGRFDGRGDFNFINGNYELMEEVKKNLIPLLVNGLRERFPYIKDDHFDDCFVAHEEPERKIGSRIKVVRAPAHVDFFYAFRNVIRKFRFHDLPTTFLDSIGVYCHPKYTGILSRIGYLSKQQHTDLIKVAGRKLPKSLRKLVLKDFNVLLFIRNVKFIKSVSNMSKMIERFARSHFDANDFEPFFHEYMKALMDKNRPNFNNEDKLYEHCETICVNRFTDADNSYWIRDTYYQLNLIREEGEEYEIDTNLTMRQLHDDVSSVLRKIRTKNKELTYTEQEEKIEWSYDKYTFKLAHDTHYLVDVGAAMNICVGGYGDRAYRKDLHIVVVSSPDNPYECCIEMSGDMKQVCQAKIKHNARPQDELLEAIMSWVDEKKLKINTRDLPGSEQEEEMIVFQQRRPAAQRLRVVEPVENNIEDVFALPAVAE